jgi:hypothetical protein
LEELTRAVGVRVRFVRGQPFEGDHAAEDMCDHIAAFGDLPVGIDFNESVLNGKEGNIFYFRVAHELSHYLCDQEMAARGHRCNFAIEGETRTMHRQAAHLLAIADRLNFKGYGHRERCRIVQATFSEVVLQVAAFYTLGDYAPQKVALLPLTTINSWLAQHDLSPLLPSLTEEAAYPAAYPVAAGVY